MRSIVLLGVVAVLALLGGMAVTGLPTDVTDDVVSSEIAPPPTTLEPSMSTPPTTAASRSTDPQPATTAPATLATTPMTTPTAATTSTVRAESELRVVVANATNRSGIAAAAAEQLRALGYATVSAANAAQPRPDTVIVFAPGFAAEAARLAGQLALPPDRLIARRADAVTVVDEPADLWVVLGADTP